MSGQGALEPLSAWGGEMGGLRGLTLWHLCGVDPDAGRPVGGWARLTKSSPDESDSLSDSGIWWLLNGTRTGHANFNSFAGKQVSSNFTS